MKIHISCDNDRDRDLMRDILRMCINVVERRLNVVSRAGLNRMDASIII